MGAQPRPDGCELDHQTVGCMSVISSWDVPTFLDLVENPLDQITRPMQIWTGADSLRAS
jgi:hypothetical protein